MRTVFGFISMKFGRVGGHSEKFRPAGERVNDISKGVSTIHQQK